MRAENRLTCGTGIIVSGNRYRIQAVRSEAVEMAAANFKNKYFVFRTVLFCLQAPIFSVIPGAYLLSALHDQLLP